MPFAKKTKILVILVGAIVLITFVLYQSEQAKVKLGLVKQQQAMQVPASTIKADVKIKYDDQENLYSGIEVEEGQTALDLIQKVATISATGEGEMTYITTINGRAAESSKKEFWEMLINEQPAQVGAGSYKVKNNDQIDWRITAIN